MFGLLHCLFSGCAKWFLSNSESIGRHVSWFTSSVVTASILSLQLCLINMNYTLEVQCLIAAYMRTALSDCKYEDISHSSCCQRNHFLVVWARLKRTDQLETQHKSYCGFEQKKINKKKMAYDGKAEYNIKILKHTLSTLGLVDG